MVGTKGQNGDLEQKKRIGHHLTRSFLLRFMVGTRGFECAKGAQAPGRGLLYPPLEGLAPLVHGGALHLSAS